MTKNVTWHSQQITREDREKLLMQKGILLWFTGMSGSGKSTLANNLAAKLHQIGRLTYVLDGDNIRHGLNSDLGFLPDERAENIRRIGEVSKLFVDAGLITMSCFISPYRKDRDSIREDLRDRFIEVYVKCPLAECEKRDPKGLYKKARAGEIRDFTGIDSEYEEPKNPEIILDTEQNTQEENTHKLFLYLKEKELI